MSQHYAVNSSLFQDQKAYSTPDELCIKEDYLIAFIQETFVFTNYIIILTGKVMCILLTLLSVVVCTETNLGMNRCGVFLVFNRNSEF